MPGADSNPPAKPRRTMPQLIHSRSHLRESSPKIGRIGKATASPSCATSRRRTWRRSRASPKSSTILSLNPPACQRTPIRPLKPGGRWWLSSLRFLQGYLSTISASRRLSSLPEKVEELCDYAGGMAWELYEMGLRLNEELAKWR
jgi:hypothetical protein